MIKAEELLAISEEDDIDKIKMQHNGDCLVPETDLVYRDELLKTLEREVKI